MPKYKVRIYKTICLFDHIEVESENDLEARKKAYIKANLEELKPDSDIKWSLEETVYKTEIIND